MMQEVRSLLSRLRRLAGLVDPVTWGWSAVFTGTVARLGLSLVASVLIARALGAAEFGVYAVLGAAGGLVAAVADFGLSTTAVKRIAVAAADASESNDLALVAGADPALGRWRAFFWLRLITAGAVVLGGMALAGPLAGSLLGLQGKTGLVRLALLDVLATLMSGAVRVALQGTSHFGRLAVALGSNSLFTVVLATILAATGTLNLVTALLVLGIGTSLASMGVGYRLLPDGWRLQWPGGKAVRHEGGELFRFGRWVWLASIFAVLAARADVLVMGRLLDPALVGAYALALNLATKADAVNQSLFTVLLPTASALEDDRPLRPYLRRSLVRSGLICLGLLLLVPLSGWLIPVLYGPDFAAAVPLFRLLLLVVAVDAFTIPFTVLVYPLNRPRLLAAANGVQAIVLIAVAVLLIPGLGAVGAVAAKLAARLANAALILAGLALLRLGGRTDRTGSPI